MPKTVPKFGSTRFAVIMAGGSGTRFWPLSRRTRPKQLLPIAGTRSMLQETAARLAPLIPPQRMVVVAGAKHAAAVRQQLPRVPAANVLVEPFGRNTAPCIAVAAEWIHRRAPGSSMAVLPADHAITQPQRFRRALARAFYVAEHNDALVTLGVQPSHPETGYGYIRVGTALDGRAPVAARVAEFKEKPDRVRARRFVASGKYLWNAGIFVWPTAAIRAALARYRPDIAAAVAQLPSASPRIPAKLYQGLPSVSIDVAVMEPAATARDSVVAVVAAEFGWSDVGSWAALAGLWGSDGDGNAARGKALLLDTANSTVYGNARGKKVIALLGVRDLVVVDAGDALLICPTSRAQDVRRVVAELERRGWREFL